MIVNFTVKNFRSFKHERTFSMEAASVREHSDSVFSAGHRKLLPVAVVYGANSSGKSNLILAMSCMFSIVLRSVQLNEGDKLAYDPFMLDNTSAGQPTLFELQFVLGDSLFRYGFEYNETEIISEWLYERKPKCRESKLFLRFREDIEVSPKNFPEGKEKDGLTNSNRLFLSLVAQLRGEKSNAILNWFRNSNILSGLKSESYEAFSLSMFMNHLDGADDAQRFFNTLQLGFTRFSVEKVDIPKTVIENAPSDIRRKLESESSSGNIVEPMTTHNIYDDNGVVVGEKEFHKNLMESEGTKKVIELSGPIFDTLKKGNRLIVDELDAKLHPLLTRNIVLLFMNPSINTKGAQLIFATHDTNLLDLSLIRRDQIWFAEKDALESTDLYSLVEFKDANGQHPRNDCDIKTNYIRGRYGAIPFIGR